MVVSASLFACADAARTSGPTTGSVEITALSIGEDIDGDGYVIRIDGNAATPLPATGRITIDGVSPGARTITLEGVAANCTSQHLNARVAVTAGLSASAEFVVTCLSKQPKEPDLYGTIQITTATNGMEKDPDGYLALVVDDVGPLTTVFLSATGTLSLQVKARKRYSVNLSGIASNCRLQSSASASQPVEVPVDGTATASFSVNCEPHYPTRLDAGSQLAFVLEGRIHLVNTDGSGVTRVTDGPDDCEPSWSPDGKRLAFVRGCGSEREIYIVNADRSNLTRRSTSLRWAMHPAWSPDGKRLAFSGFSQGSSAVFLMSADDDGRAPVELLNRPGYDAMPSWSPDGNTIAFVSDWVAYDFTYDIYRMPVSGGLIDQLTNGFGFGPALLQYYYPAWSPDGKSLAVLRCPNAYYTCDEGTIGVLQADGSSITTVAAVSGGFGRLSWSSDGSLIVFSSHGSVGWVRPSTGERGFISEGHSPAWRPVVASTSSTR